MALSIKLLLKEKRGDFQRNSCYKQIGKTEKSAEMHASSVNLYILKYYN